MKPIKTLIAEASCEFSTTHKRLRIFDTSEASLVEKLQNTILENKLSNKIQVKFKLKTIQL